MRALGDAPQPVRAVVHGVERRHHRQQRLRRADIAGGLFAADVLLAGLQCHAQGRVTVAVLRHADDAPRRGALVGIARGEERGVGATVAHGDAEALAAADHHVGTGGTGGAQQRQGEQVRRHRHQRVRGMRGADQRFDVLHGAAAARVGQEQAEGVLGGDQLGGVANVHLDAQGARPRFQNRQGLGMAVRVDQEHVALRLAVHALQQRHGFRGRRGLVEHRGIGQFHPREVHDHLLVGEQCLEAALGYLRLVGRVGRVPARVLQHVALDDRRSVGAVVPHADVAASQLVARCHVAKARQHIDLAPGAGQLQGLGTANARGDGRVDQRVDAVVADGLRHFLLLRGGGSDVAAQKLILAE
jgi:hypothetical protein